ncbi:MAG TPA: hypothetical protein VGI20_07655 [Rhizomicrobium sp.]|jgi:hypothetical protein
MPSNQLPDPFLVFLTDPILLAGILLPLVILAGLLFFRIRASRRFAALTKQNEERWKESAARTEKMIELLTEIRDHAARIAPNSPGSGTGNP